MCEKGTRQLSEKAPKPNSSTEENHDADAALWARFAGSAGDEVSAPSLSDADLKRSRDKFALYLKDVRVADSQRGAALLENRWRIGHERLDLSDNESPWRSASPSRHFADRLHRFDWLSDLIDQGSEGADRGRQLVDDWCALFGKFHAFHWRLGPLAARVWNWLKVGAPLFEYGSPEVYGLRMSVLRAQIEYLRSLLDTTHDAEARWTGRCILVAHSLLCDGGKSFEHSLHLLEAECTTQILPDGGHVTRSPQTLLYCLCDLLILRDVLERANRQVPDFFDKWIPRMGAMLNFFTLPDGALAPFNNSSEDRAETVAAVFQALGKPHRKFSFAMKSGFQKLEKGPLSLILDAGSAPPMPFAGKAHSGPLGFILSDGDARIITSSAFSPEVNLDWQAAIRRTNAHSTLHLLGRDANKFETYEGTQLLCPVGPEGISTKRLEEADEIWLDSQHGGWKANFGLIHRRRLFMSGDGAKVTGEDSVVRPISLGIDEDGKFISFDIRFHLHPSVHAETKGDSILLTCENGTIWSFRTTHAGTRLETSRYLGRGLVESTRQIVMSGRADPNGDGSVPPNCIRWGFRRVEAGT